MEMNNYLLTQMINLRVNYQPQLVSNISSINSTFPRIWYLLRGSMLPWQFSNPTLAAIPMCSSKVCRSAGFLAVTATWDVGGTPTPENWHRTKKSALWKGRSSFKHPLLCSMLIFQGVTLNPMILWMQKMPQFCTERIAWTQDARMAKSLQLTLRLCAMLDMLKISDKMSPRDHEMIIRRYHKDYAEWRRGHKWNPSWNHLEKW